MLAMLLASVSVAGAETSTASYWSSGISWIQDTAVGNSSLIPSLSSMSNILPEKSSLIPSLSSMSNIFPDNSSLIPSLSSMSNMFPDFVQEEYDPLSEGLLDVL